MRLSSANFSQSSTSWNTLFIVIATLRRDLLTTHGWSYSALKDTLKSVYCFHLPPVVDDRLELVLIILDFLKPLPGALTASLFDLVDIFVSQYDVEDGDDEENSANEGL